MTRNEQRLVFIFLIVAAAGLLFLFLNRYRFYYNYVKIAFHESDETAVTAGDNSTDTEKRRGAESAERGVQSGEAGAARGDTGGRAGGSKAPAGKIDINHAGVNELMSLPGIGRVTALNIIEYRTRKGGFTDVNELIEVEGIGPKKLEALLNYVVLEQRANIF